MTQVTKESLAEKIKYLEDLGSMISLNEEYQLAAYRKLAEFFEECRHTYGLIHGSRYCHRCGEKLID